MIKGLTQEPEVGEHLHGHGEEDHRTSARSWRSCRAPTACSTSARSRTSASNASTDVLNEGDEVIVKCIRVDREDGKIRLSRKEALSANPPPEEVHNFVI